MCDEPFQHPDAKDRNTIFDNMASGELFAR